MFLTVFPGSTSVSGACQAHSKSCLNELMKERIEESSSFPQVHSVSRPQFALAAKAGSFCLPLRSGRVMCLCKQPFTQVSRGATEREHTFIPSPTVMMQKSWLISLHFSRQGWSGSLLGSDWSGANPDSHPYSFHAHVTASAVTLQDKYQHPKLPYY